MFHVKHFIKICALALLFQACIPISIPPQIENYRIEEPKRKFKSYRFTFISDNPYQITNYFERLNFKEEGINGYSTSINNKKFFFFINYKTKTGQYIDLLGIIIDKNSEPFQETDEVKYVSISVFDENGDDCLNPNSLFKDIVLKELVNHKDKFAAMY